MYILEKKVDGVTKKCNCDREQLDDMLKAGWKQEGADSGEADSEASQKAPVEAAPKLKAAPKAAK